MKLELRIGKVNTTFMLTNEDRKLLKPTEPTLVKRRAIVHISKEGANLGKNEVGMKEPNVNRSGCREGRCLGGKATEVIAPALTEHRGHERAIGIPDATEAAAVGEVRHQVRRRATRTLDGNAGPMVAVERNIIEKRNGQSEKRSDQQVVTRKKNQHVASFSE